MSLELLYYRYVHIETKTKLLLSLGAQLVKAFLHHLCTESIF